MAITPHILLPRRQLPRRPTTRQRATSSRESRTQLRRGNKPRSSSCLVGKRLHPMASCHAWGVASYTLATLQQSTSACSMWTAALWLAPSASQLDCGRRRQRPHRCCSVLCMPRCQDKMRKWQAAIHALELLPFDAFNSSLVYTTSTIGYDKYASRLQSSRLSKLESEIITKV